MTPLTWINPLGLWWLLLVPALILIYMLRAKPQRLTVSSLRLWKNLPDIDRPRARLRRPPLSMLLLLQVLLLAAGAFALTRPALTAPASGRTLILLDASGSMLAQEGGTTRFERARSAAEGIIDGLASAARGSLLRVGPTVTTLCSNCTLADMRSTLKNARPGSGKGDWQSALQIANGLAAGAPGKTETVVISDGAFDALPAESLPPFVRFVQIGHDEDNRAITEISARKQPDGSPGYVAYVRVDNFGGDTSLNVNSLADTVPQPVRSLDLPANGHADLVWHLPAGTAKFTVSIDSRDALLDDNQAVLFLPEKAHNVRIISPQPGVYSRVLADLPGLQAQTDAKEASDTAFTIIEGRYADALPGGGLLLVSPDMAFLPSTGEVTGARPQLTGSSHPLIQGVDLRALFVLRAQQYTVPAWLEPVLNSDKGPLILAGEQNGQRVAVLTFSPSDSNLTKLAAYPLLMQNLADWLFPLAGTQALNPGEPTRLQPSVSVKTPKGRPVEAAQSGEFLDTDEVGIYSVAAGTSSEAQFAVNMAGTGESDVSPRQHPELQKHQAATEEGQVPGKELWPPLAAAALLLAGIEWLFYSWKRGRV